MAPADCVQVSSLRYSVTAVRRCAEGWNRCCGLPPISGMAARQQDRLPRRPLIMSARLSGSAGGGNVVSRPAGLRMNSITNRGFQHLEPGC
jgi:hypothetical protein